MNEEIENSTKEIAPKKGSFFKKIVIVLLLLLIVFYLYIRFGEPNRLVTHEYAIVDNNLPYSFHGLKIVHFSDILYGSTINEKNLNKVVEKINEWKPDVLIYTGDLLNNTVKLNDTDKSTIKEILAKTTATYKKYAVIGDNDYVDKNAYIEIMESSGFMVLNNKNDLLYYGGNEPLVFMGTNSLLEQEYDVTMANTSIEDISNAYKIWIGHEPVIIEELFRSEIKPNLIFTGHTLKGLIKFPFGGYLLNQQGVNSYMEDSYEIDSTKMYISSGLGTYKYPIRFNNPPSINLYRLYQY